MFSHQLHSQPKSSVVFHWFLLSFSGGFINAGGFLATGKFVSHVTGFATLFGVEAATNHIWSAVSLLIVPSFFMLGAFLAGLLVERPLEQRRRSHFDVVMLISSICLFVCASNILHFRNFGETLSTLHSFVVTTLLCVACGLQNGAITSSSNQSVRTTHLTGITTDLGLGLARLLVMQPNSKRHRIEIYASQLRAGSIVFFIFGSAVGAVIFLRVGYVGFYFPAAIAFYTAVRAACDNRQNITSE